MFLKIFIPQLGVNDEKVTVVKWLVNDNEFIKQGQTICEVETSKVVFEVESPYEGYIKILIDKGIEIPIDQCVALVAKSSNLNVDKKKYIKIAEPVEKSQKTSKVNYTRKAMEYAIKHSFNIEIIQKKGLITAADVEEYIEKIEKPVKKSTGKSAAARLSRKKSAKKQLPNNCIAIYGTGLGAMTAKDYIESEGIYSIKYFIEDFADITNIYNTPVIQGKDLQHIKDEICGVVCFIANNKFRLKVLSVLDQLGLESISVISSKADIRTSAKIGRAVFIKDGALIGGGCEIGDCCVIDNHVTVAHHCFIGDGCFLAPGVDIGGGVKIGKKTIIGVGASIASKVVIGDNVIVSVGASVHNDVPDNCVIEGSPGRIIGERKV